MRRKVRWPHDRTQSSPTTYNIAVSAGLRLAKLSGRSCTRERQGQRKNGARARRAALDHKCAAKSFCKVATDKKAKPYAGDDDSRIRDPIKPIENPLALVLRDSDSVVRDANDRAPGVS